MPELTIKDDELKTLDQLIGQIPTTYGYQIVTFLNAIGVKRQQEAEQAAIAAKPAPIPEVAQGPAEKPAEPIL